jgi:hypothetical protein
MINRDSKNATTGLKKIVFKTDLPGQYVNDILDKYAVMQILNISERTLKNYVKEGFLRCSTIRGKSYYLYRDLLEMIEKYKRKR